MCIFYARQIKYTTKKVDILRYHLFLTIFVIWQLKSAPPQHNLFATARRYAWRVFKGLKKRADHTTSLWSFFCELFATGEWVVCRFSRLCPLLAALFASMGPPPHTFKNLQIALTTFVVFSHYLFILLLFIYLTFALSPTLLVHF